MRMIGLLAFGLAVVAAWTLVRYSVPSQLRAATHAHARTVDLALDEHNQATVSRRLALRERSGAVMAVLMSLSAVVWLLRDGGAVVDRSPWSPFLVVLGFFLGHAVGHAAAAWYESSRPVPEGLPRMARAITPTHDDYIARHERWGSWVFAAVSTMTAAVLVIADGTGLVELGALPWPLVVLAAVGPWLAVGLDEVFARRLLRRRQVAATTLELAWDDALRARTLRDMVTVSLVVAAFAPLGLLAVVADGLDGGWPANPAVGLVNGIFGLLLGALVVIALVSLALNPQRHFRRRLWPELERSQQASVPGPAVQR